MTDTVSLSLDSTFGNSGKVITDINSSSEWGMYLAKQSDGKIFIAGKTLNGSRADVALARYNNTGTLDNTFDNDGKVTTNIGGDFFAGGVALQSDGKIVVAGSIWDSNNNNYDIVVLRYNADGTLDTSFDSDGKAITNIGTKDDTGYGLALQSDGKILVTGLTQDGVAIHIGLVRFNSNGQLDNTFDNDGKVTTNIDPYSNDDRGLSVAVQSDNKILVTGTTYNSLYSDETAICLARYNSDGTLDTSFSGDGVLMTQIGSFSNQGNQVSNYPGGKILVAGATGNSDDTNDFALVRYNNDGTLDTSFSGDGKVSTPVGTGNDLGKALLIQSDGKIILAGYAGNSTSDFGLVRYNVDGTIDTSFDGDGKVITPIGNSDDFATGILIQGDGKIILGGSAWNSDNADFALVRYNLNIKNNSTQGTSSNDTLPGTSSSEIIRGLGGNDLIGGQAGNDTLIGGIGNDIYLVNSVGDKVIESIDADNDLIKSSVNYQLPGNVEKIILTGADNIQAQGNAQGNIIKGNSGNNTLQGRAGNDTLTGGLGSDRFLYDSNANFTFASLGQDVITDFNKTQADKIVLDKNTFTKISSMPGQGFSIVKEFAKVTTDSQAQISSADIVYNTTNGKLFYNENGNIAGFGSGGLFITLLNKPQLLGTDFMMQT